MSAEVGGQDDHVKDTSLRTRLSEVKQKLQSPIESREELLELLLAPLDLLQVVLPDLPAHLAKYAVWKGDNDEDRRKIHTAHAWISDVQKLLVEKVLVDWYDEVQTMPWLLEAWFAPVSGSGRGDGSKMTSPATAGSIYVATLATLTAILSSASLKHRTSSSTSSSTPLGLALPSESVTLVKRVCALFCEHFSLRAVSESLLGYNTKAKGEIVWTNVVRELTSLPERAANATNGRGPIELERRHFVKTMAAQIEDLLHSPCPPGLIAVLLAKLLRGGYLEETTSDQIEPTTIWPTFFRVYISRGRRNAVSWTKAMRSLPVSTRTSISLSLISFVDTCSLRRLRSSSLLNDDEWSRPGTEGRSFLNAKTWTSVLLVASTIEPFLTAGLSSSASRKEAEDSDSDEEDDDGDASLLEICLLPSSAGYWSPLTARLLMEIICRHSSQSRLSRILSKVIESWSSAPRIKTGLWEQEVYLTTIILLLVAQLPATSTIALCTSATFISGVSAHLEHLSPKVRRMGMLVAEIVSSASGGKALAFGRSIWDGKNEGKEEARVLRALHYSWKDRDTEATETDEQSRLSAFGLSAKMEVVKREALSPTKEGRLAPKTRSLPTKRSAPSRQKLLIQSMDGEDGLQVENLRDDSLPSLTNIGGIRGASSGIQQTAFTSDGEVSSSSESESSDSEAEGGNIPKDPVEKKEEFGLGMPQKKKRRIPLYIHELAPLFREQEREANKLALKHAEPLIKRKTGWGGEVDENAINLALAILNMQNNFGFKLFEERKKLALTALVYASPRLVAPCLAEQYFNQQHSMAQRICILNSLAFGAHGVSGKHAEETTLKTLADGFAHMAIVRSRVEGERRVPQIRPEDKSVLLHQHSAPKTLDTGVAPSRSKLANGSNVYLDLAGPSFIFPLVNRFWAHLDHANATRSSRYRGSGSSILFDSFLIGAFLDTLAVLCYCAQNALNFSSDIVPEVISLALTMTNSALARLSQGDEASDSQGGGPLSILGAAANLFLLLFDAVSEVDSGRTLLQRHRNTVQEVEVWAQAVFESVEANAGIDRAGRCSAALLVRINEIKMGQR